MNLIAALKRVQALPGAEVPDLRGQRAARTPRLQGEVGAARHRTEPAEVRGHRSDKTRVASEAGGGHAGPGELRASRARGPGKGVV